MYQPRPAGTRWLMMFVLSIIICGSFLIYWGLNTAPVRRRIEAIPFYAQTYWNRLRPTPEIPPPPNISAISPETLLQTHPPANEVPEVLSDTPPLFNDAALNPNQNRRPPSSANGNANPNTVMLVESTTLSAKPIAPQVALSGIIHHWQTWNNCGPATIAMNLSYYGQTGTQVESARFLKPNQEDKNVNPQELAAYARTLGYEATVRVGGDIALLKRLLSNDLPVIVEIWLDPEDNGGLGHYRLLTGYDEAGGYFTAEDSLNGTNIQVPFAEFVPFWRVFNRTYVVVYPPDQTALVHAVLGPAMLDQTMYTAALIMAQTEAQANPADAYAWFNMGTNYARLGQPELAASAFDEARRIGLPYRMLWYQFDIFASYLTVGRYQEVADLSSAILRATGGLEELYYYRGLARQALGQTGPARNDFQAALDYNANFTPAVDALARLGTS